jgi:hypothetical protein
MLFLFKVIFVYLNTFVASFKIIFENSKNLQRICVQFGSQVFFLSSTF